MNDVRTSVRERYGRIASQGQVAGCCGGESACGAGYTEAERQALPDGADLGLGCGAPIPIAGLRAGETVLDLGSGGGVDCFLAAEKVGETGRVVGVDMTPEMVDRARKAAARAGVANVEFRLGEIEHLPVADESVDAVVSNCVVNLSPDKPAVFREAFRVLRPGGRLAIADMVATEPLSGTIRRDLDAYTGCVGGAVEIPLLETLLQEAGFDEVRIVPGAGTGTGPGAVVPAILEAVKSPR